MRRAFAYAGVAFALAVGALITPAVTPTAPVDAAAPRQLALGVSSLPFDDMNNVDAHTAALGRAPAIWSVWSDWGQSTQNFPAATLNSLRARGIVPMIIWEPVVPGLGPNFQWQDVINGSYDTYIRAYAQAAKDWGATIILRFAHEMDGVWFPWGSGHGSNTPARFVAGWRHVWSIFKGPGGVGASNVKFLWSPNVAKAEYFPGNAYVDFVGFSAFNWAKHDSWTTMGTLLNIRAGRMRKITKKPEIVAEIGSNSAPGNKATWITNGYKTAYTKYPLIAAIVYFDINMASQGQPDWRLTTPPAAMTAYTNLVADPNYQGTLVSPVATISLPSQVITASPSPVTVNLTFSSSDTYGVGITRFFVSSSSTPPLRNDPNWTTTKPTQFTLSAGFGAQSVYAWVEDGNGIISPAAHATTTRRSTTSTSVQSNTNPSTFHQGVTLTASVTTPAAGTVVDGTVDFKSDGSDIVGCTAQPVSGGSATCGPITGLATGSHPIVAYYNGGSIFATSNSGGSPLTQSVKKASSTTSVTSNINPSTYGRGVTFTATVTSTAGTIGGGTVKFQSDGVNIPGCAAQAVTAGSATCGPISNLTLPSHQITAFFSGSTNFAASDNSGSALSQTVNQASTMTTVGADVNASTYGDNVTFTATVSSTGGTVNSGQVKFQSDGNDIVDCTTQSVSAGSATCSTTGLEAGTHSITAYFTGSTNFADSDNSGSAYSQTVNQAPTTASVVSDNNPASINQPVNLTATISSTAGTVSDGAVEFKSDGADIPGCESISVSSPGTATCGFTVGSVGSNITVFFSGSTDFAGSDNSASPYPQDVN